MNSQFANAVNSTTGNTAPGKPGRPPSSRSTAAVQQQQPTAAASQIQHPPPKTDKPRPHVCATCTRPFARLEHLKRHERSHTKEKPFECPECTRCFARRDLLLRHQQKLHFQTTPSSRPRNGSRRDSQPNLQTGTTGGRVRKNSVSTASTTTTATVTGRPRANTIAHVDTTTLGLMASSNTNNVNTESHTNRAPRISKINTSSMGMGLGSMNNSNMVQANNVDLDGMFFATINPASLQLYGSPLLQPLGSPTSPFGTSRFPGLDSHYSVNDDDENFEWLNPFRTTIDEGGSPSAVSTTSQSGISEVLLESNWGGHLTSTTSTTSMSSHYNSQATTDYSYSSYGNTPPGTVSPRSLMQASASEGLYPAPALSGLPLSPSMAHANFSPYPVYGPDPPATTRTTASMIQSVVDSLCDATRNALLTTLALPSAFTASVNGGGGPRRRYSTSSASGLTVNYFSNTRPAPSVALPSTDDLKRYVSAFLENFYPHMPFLHIPTLRLDSTAFTTTYKDINQRGVTGGAGCLVLAMASIGALYIAPHSARELFESTKKTIQVALDDRRKQEVAAAVNGIQSQLRHSSDGNRHTPLWLVQALLLNVMFGLHCGDQQAVKGSKAFCSALVSLARSACLMTKVADEDDKEVDIKMADLGLAGFGDDDDGWPNLNNEVDEEEKWTKWVNKEERKRTLFGIHFLNSILVACHNYQPLFTNADIHLDLPCHEELWSACSSAVWRDQGGAIFAEQTSLDFQDALSALFASSQQPYPPPPDYDGSQNLPCGPSQIVTSVWGCLALLCAIHVYIWEVRHQQGNRWTASDAEAMHAHIEPALKAWQNAWFNIPHNRCERNGTYIMPPLAADCIPMLDIAYTRLFVDFGRVKDAFWANDMETMAEQLSKGWTTYNSNMGGNGSPSSTSSVSFASDALVSPHSPASSPASTNSSPNLHPIKHESGPGLNFNVNSANSLNAGPTRREKHLRRAACYAADSLSMSGPMFTGNSSDSDWNHPIQFPFCTFDCALVLGEWIATVQERVGPCMGILGSEECNLESLEGFMMLEDEDRTLLQKVIALLVEAENKFAMKWNSNFSAMRMGAKVPSRSGNEGGLASMVFMLGAFMLDKMMVWPVAHNMAQALRSQAAHMEDRIPDNFSLQH